VDNDGFITRDEMYNIVDAIYQMVVSASPSKRPRWQEKAFDVKRFADRFSISFPLNTSCHFSQSPRDNAIHYFSRIGPPSSLLNLPTIASV